MRLTIVQYDIAWEAKEKNFERIEKLLGPGFGNTDLVVLPEMFSTGFSMDALKFSEPPGSLTCEWMAETASKGNFGLCGSFIAVENDQYYNRWLFVTPGKEVFIYDKRHLFSIEGEDKVYSPGRTRIVFSFRGIRICPNICYDLRFPVWSRNRNDYDLLINSANWPGSRRVVWQTLLRARAIENQCYVAGSNRTGIDGNGIFYTGDSVIIGPKGETISDSAENIEGLINGEISLSELDDFRRKFPVSEDADDFILSL